MTETSIATKSGFLSSIFRKKPPSEEAIAFARQYVARKERLKKEREERLKRPAYVELQEKLAEAGLSGDIKQIVGRWCSYWHVAKDEGWGADYPYVSQIIGVSTDMSRRPELALSFGPGGVPRSLYWQQDLGLWGYWQYTDRDPGWNPVLDFQLL